MKNIIWIAIALILAIINGDTGPFVTVMTWALEAGLCLGAIIIAFRIAKTPFANR